MERRKLKPFVMPMLYGIACAAIIMSIVLLSQSKSQDVMLNDEDFIYVNNSILTDEIPVIKEDSIISKPFLSEKVQVLKKFYDISSSDEEKKNAIIYFDDTYVQNSGILYKSDSQFEITSVLDGTVVDIKKDEILGMVVEVKHSNNLISTYEGLSTVEVKKNSEIHQGDVIGKSGKINVGDPIENGLLFELIYNGKIVNPDKFYDKKVNEL